MSEASQQGASATHGSPTAGALTDAPADRGGFPWVRILFVIALVGLDLWSKSAVFTWLSPNGWPALPEGVERWAINGHVRYPVWGDFLGFMLSENKGAAWGVGDQVPHLLVGGRVVAVLVIGWMLLRAPRRPWYGLWALVLVEAGAIGNLYDNLTRTPEEGHPYGSVRDFIHVYFERWSYHFPTFNVADSCICVGAGLLILSGFLPGARAEDAAPGQGEPTDAGESAAG